MIGLSAKAVRVRVFVAGIGVAGLMMAGCSSSGSSSSGGSSPAASQPKTLAEVLAKVANLTGTQRRAELIRLAKAEGGTVTHYTGNSEDASKLLADAFTKETGIKVNRLRLNPTDLLSRVTQEASANKLGADTILSNGREMVVLEQKGILAPLKTPASEGIPAGEVFDTWVTTFVAPYVAAWNTKSVSGDNVPKTWNDVLTKYGSSLGTETEDFDWMACIIKNVLEPRGMSETQAVDLFRTGITKSRAVTGHTLMTNLLGAGQFKVIASPYEDAIAHLKKKGAPVSDEPLIAPVCEALAGVGISKTTTHPAAALLYAEWLMTDGQKANFDGIGKNPSNPAYGGFQKTAVDEGVKLFPIGKDILLNERNKWEPLYNSMIAKAGKAS